jgi:hypothetical protein
MIYLDVISKINAESKHASGLDLPCLAGKAEEVRSRNSQVRSQKSEVRSRKSEVALLGHRMIVHKLQLVNSQPEISECIIP